MRNFKILFLITLAVLGLCIIPEIGECAAASSDSRDTQSGTSASGVLQAAVDGNDGEGGDDGNDDDDGDDDDDDGDDDDDDSGGDDGDGDGHES